MLALISGSIMAQSVSFSAKPQKPLIPEGETHAHVLLRLKAAGAPDDEQPKKLNLALVIDRSGSMRGQKIIDARNSAIKMIEKMRDGDTVSVISYSDDVRVDVEPSQLNDAARVKIEAIVHTIGENGSTNLGGGLVKGIEKAKQNLKKAEVSRVLLISDGLANRGVTDPAALNKISRESLQSGVVVTTLGLGVDYNEDLMTSVADNGGGNYYFIEKSDQIVATLNQELSQMAKTVGKGLQCQNKLAAGVSLEEMYGWIFKTEGAEVQASFGEIFADQHRTVLCKFKLPDGLKKGQQVQIHPFVLRYTETLDGKEVRRQVKTEPIQLRVTDDGNAVLTAQDMEVTARIAEIQLATRLENVAKLVQEGKFSEAKELIHKAVQSAKEDQASIPKEYLDRLMRATEDAEQLVGDVDRAEESVYERKKVMKNSKSKSYKFKK